MKWYLRTEGGSEFQIDSKDVEAMELEIDGIRYEITIKEYGN